MAMIKCRECGQKVSELATACPHCGTPVKITVVNGQNLYIVRCQSEAKAGKKALLYIDDVYIQEMGNGSSYRSSLGPGVHTIELYCDQKPVCKARTHILASQVTTLRYKLGDSSTEVELDNFTEPKTVPPKPPEKSYGWGEIIFVILLLTMAFLLAAYFRK